MIFTGIDGDKSFSIDYSPVKKEWKPTERSGRRIEVIPSHLSYVRKERTQIKNLYDLRRALSVEVEERFGDVVWDVELQGDTYCLALIREFTPKEDYFALDPEVFSLARVCRALSIEECFVLDIGRRKTTLVDISGGELAAYRVVLKGEDYLIQRLAKALGVDEGKARDLLKKKGAEEKEVSSALENILSSLGKELKGKPVLLSGGVSRLKGLESMFERVLRNSFVPPELNSAFGASLKYVYRDCSPDFREEELSEKDLKKVVAVFGVSFLLFLSANLGLDLLKKKVVSEIRDREKAEFTKKFPGMPAVAVRDQVKSMSAQERYPFTRRLSAISEKLKEGMKIYRIEFENNTLKVVGEVGGEEMLAELKPKSVKKTPEGNLEFEVEIK